MAKRHNHYEAAFEDYLRSRQIAYVAVNEQRRALDPGGTLKSVDFIVSPANEGPIADSSWEAPAWEAPTGKTPAGETTAGETLSRWLVDVKGRRFPSGRQYWRNWTTEEELHSLARWGDRFGDAFMGMLVFAYELTGDHSPVPPHEVHYYANRPYAFVAVPAATYHALARPLSARWGTVAVPTADFRRAARPVATALGSQPAAAATA